MHKLTLRLALLTGIALTCNAQAALHDRGGGLLYDDVLDVTWLQDANYVKTQQEAGIATMSDGAGRMTWDNATAWVNDLNYYDSVRGVNYDDWRLPGMQDTGFSGCDFAVAGSDCGYNVQTINAATGEVYSELAYMYYVNLGLKAYYSPTGAFQADWGIFGNGTLNGTDFDSYGQANVGLVNNLQPYKYWTGTEYAAVPTGAWYFGGDYGTQFTDGKFVEAHVWAVRSGDVLAAPVPEPETYALLLTGLALVGWQSQRRRKSLAAAQPVQK